MTEKTFNLPDREWAEWASEKTGKPSAEYWGQSLFYLTEVEGIDFDEALKIMEKKWENNDI